MLIFFIIQFATLYMPGTEESSGRAPKARKRPGFGRSATLNNTGMPERSESICSPTIATLEALASGMGKKLIVSFE